MKKDKKIKVGDIYYRYGLCWETEQPTILRLFVGAKKRDYYICVEQTLEGRERVLKLDEDSIRLLYPFNSKRKAVDYSFKEIEAEIEAAKQRIKEMREKKKLFITFKNLRFKRLKNGEIIKKR